MLERRQKSSERCMQPAGGAKSFEYPACSFCLLAVGGKTEGTVGLDGYLSTKQIPTHCNYIILYSIIVVSKRLLGCSPGFQGLTKSLAVKTKTWKTCSMQFQLAWSHCYGCSQSTFFRFFSSSQFSPMKSPA